MPSRSVLCRSRLAALALTITGCAAAAPTAGAAITPSAQPLAALSETNRPSCSSAIAPFVNTDLIGFDAQVYLTEGRGRAALRAELEATARGADLQPSVTICSPAFAGLPGPVSGTTASLLDRSRVGHGWREVGSTLLNPAPLLPGDTLTVPPVDDASELRLNIAPAAGQPTSVARLTDLSPGPSQVTIGRDTTGLVARIERPDGTTASVAVPVRKVPRLAARISGSARRWTVTTHQLAGSTVVVRAGWRLGEDYVSASTLRSSGRATTLRSVLRVSQARAAGKPVSVLVVATNRSAQKLELATCTFRVDRRSRPGALRCKDYPLSRVVTDYLADRLGAGVRSTVDGQDAARILQEVRSLLAEVGATAADASRTVAARAAARPRAAATDRSARATAPVAPLVLAVASRSPEMVQVGGRALRSLGNDVNGDGAPDFWTDDLAVRPARPARGAIAGYLFVSGPSGMSPHRVEAPSMPANRGLAASDLNDAEASELSAIADITGDGIGELVVDLGERHAIIPGSAAWTGTSAPIVAPDPSHPDGEAIVVAPGLSSPGSPYRTLDDVTGDGVRELAYSDDSASWLSVASEAVHRGSVTALPSAVPPLPLPFQLGQTLLIEGARPYESPGIAIISGRAITQRWLRVATRRSRAGRLTVAVRDALGRPVVPAFTIDTPGDAAVIDYDRASGDLLLRAEDVACDTDRYGDDKGTCGERLLRVNGLGVVKQTLVVRDTYAGLAIGSARFFRDGPDADTASEVVMIDGRRAVALLPSTVSGTIAAASLSRAPLPIPAGFTDIRDDLIRLTPVDGTDGERHLAIALPATVADARHTYMTPGAGPAELVWK